MRLLRTFQIGTTATKYSGQNYYTPPQHVVSNIDHLYSLSSLVVERSMKKLELASGHNEYSKKW
jgi:hypothetical protein